MNASIPRRDVAEALRAMPIDQFARGLHRLLQGGDPCEQQPAEPHVTIQDRILAVLSDGGELTAADAARAADVAAASAHSAMQTLKAKGLVVSARPRGPWAPTVWRRA